MDENGLQFFNLIDQNAIGCWNSVLSYSPINQAIVARHDEAMIFPSDIKVQDYINGVSHGGGGGGDGGNYFATGDGQTGTLLVTKCNDPRSVIPPPLPFTLSCNHSSLAG